MKFGIMFANVGPFGAPDRAAHLAQKAEQVGVESLWTVEHVVVPKGYGSQYPYSRDGRMPGPEESPIPDPLIWMTYAAAVTTKIKVATGVLILPQRHPFYVAKELATLDVLSRGRAILGVGIGWLEEEFRGVGVPFKERASRTEESIRALRSLWGEKPSEFAGKHFNWGAVESNPKPVQKPGVPIVIGGHAPGAAKRAARYGDGFFPARADLLPSLLEVLVKECHEIGRDPTDIEITTGSVPKLDEVKRLEDLGVRRFTVAPPGFTQDDVERGLDRLGDELISKA
ncbi:MAG TPA: LLM class F420-dependent oxidoreductase [Myxococcota bacterium]|jgi:probable F420-dependent oxidoreductase